MNLTTLLNRAKEKRCCLQHEDLVTLLSLRETHEIQELFQAAYQVKLHWIGANVSLRGLIETGNVCRKNCYYCGIRKDNHAVERYQLTEDQIVQMARWAFEHDYGSLALQGGEIESEANTGRFESVLQRIHEFGKDDFGITLSLGEQTAEVYRRWKSAGAHRYLLRIETSDPELYK